MRTRFRRLRRLCLERLESRDVPAVASMVADINPGPPSGLSSQTRPTAYGNLLLMNANDGVRGWGLWKSDGTAAGTEMVKQIVPFQGPLMANFSTNMGGIMYGSVNDVAHGTELWRTDGTEAGTWMVADIKTGAGSSSPRTINNLPGGEDGTREVMEVVDNVLYFSADDGIHGRELWRSDGTAAGTWMVADLFPGPVGFLDGLTVTIGSAIYARFDDGVHGAELWRSDRTPAGTTLVKDIRPGPASGLNLLSVVGNLLMLDADDGVNGREAWLSDGTEAGTILLDLEPGAMSSTPYRAVQQRLVNGNLIGSFSASQGGTRHFWVTDGTAAGTFQPFPTLSNVTFVSSGVTGFIRANNRCFFTARQNGGPLELWSSDGTAAGTELLATTQFSLFSAPATSGSRFFFRRFITDNSTELWMSDGTAAGTSLVELSGGSGSFSSNHYADVNGSTFFSGGVSAYGTELWRIDEANAPPQVSSTRVNDGTGQRSRVTTLTVTFNTPVTFAGPVASAFTLTRTGGGSVSFTATASLVNGVTVVVLAGFTGPETEFGSLRDGNYTLTALAAQISAGGQQMTANYEYAFHRLYGDANGDRTVNAQDFAQFRGAFGSGTGQPAYVEWLDLDGDGFINAFDFAQFRTRFGSSVP